MYKLMTRHNEKLNKDHQLMTIKRTTKDEKIYKGLITAEVVVLLLVNILSFIVNK